MILLDWYEWDLVLIFRKHLSSMQHVTFCSDVCHVFQDAVRSGFESMINPTFERSCRAMTEQIENAFQTGMAEHTTQAQQQLASKNTDLANILEVFCTILPVHLHSCSYC